MTDSRPSSPLPGALRVFARPLAAGYARIIGSRNAAFDAGRGVVEIDRPVISVGNLSVGGTGKSPTVAWVVRALVEAGHHPAIAMRGYGGGASGSDEAEEYRESLDGVPVIAQPDRLAGLLALVATEQGERCDCVVLDDGFQHRRIARQLDIVLVDATRDPFSDRLLPSGWLREPVASLARAGVVVLTHAESVPAAKVSSLKRDVSRIKPALKIAVARHVWKSLSVVGAEGGERNEPVAWLRGKRVVAACGIGNPGPFVKSVSDAAGNPAVEFIRPDHDPFVPRTLQQLLDLAKTKAVDAIAVTGKDWPKLRCVRPDAWPCPVVRANLEIAFDEGGEMLKLAVLDAAGAVLPAREQ